LKNRAAEKTKTAGSTDEKATAKTEGVRKKTEK
jgi:hypothetical protein